MLKWNRRQTFAICRRTIVCLIPSKSVRVLALISTNFCLSSLLVAESIFTSMSLTCLMITWRYASVSVSFLSKSEMDGVCTSLFLALLRWVWRRMVSSNEDTHLTLSSESFAKNEREMIDYYTTRFFRWPHLERLKSNSCSSHNTEYNSNVMEHEREARTFSIKYKKTWKAIYFSIYDSKDKHTHTHPENGTSCRQLWW